MRFCGETSLLWCSKMGRRKGTENGELQFIHLSCGCFLKVHAGRKTGKLSLCCHTAGCISSLHTVYIGKEGRRRPNRLGIDLNSTFRFFLSLSAYTGRISRGRGSQFSEFPSLVPGTFFPSSSCAKVDCFFCRLFLLREERGKSENDFFTGAFSTIRKI